MRLPEKIIGNNKIRDAAICLEFERLIEDDRYTQIKMIQQAVAEKFELSERRILQIVRLNHAYIPLDKAWEKKKRINRLKIEIKQKEKSNKDVADLLDQLRVEVEGNKIEHSGKIEGGTIIFNKIDIHKNPDELLGDITNRLALQFNKE